MEKPLKCPICKRPLKAEAQGRHQPFCSQRCADMDLSRWLNGSYAIPAVEAADPDGEGEAAEGEGLP